MNPAVALDAEQPANKMTVAEAAEDSAAVLVNHVRCTQLPVQTAEKKPKFPSVLAATVLFTAATASVARDVNISFI